MIAMYEQAPTVSLRGYAAELDGRVLGVVGVAYSNPLQCFSMISAELKEHPRQIVEAMRATRQLLDSIEVPVYATPDEDEVATADGFLRHVGFEQLEEGVYRWRKP